MADHWQICFDNGHQQRYLPDRQSVLRYVLAIGPRAASPRFEVFAESTSARLAGGQPAGRTFALVDVIDLSRPGEADRLRTELAALSTEPADLPAEPADLPAEPADLPAEPADLPAEPADLSVEPARPAGDRP